MNERMNKRTNEFSMHCRRQQAKAGGTFRRYKEREFEHTIIKTLLMHYKCPAVDATICNNSYIA